MFCESPQTDLVHDIERSPEPPTSPRPRSANTPNPLPFLLVFTKVTKSPDENEVLPSQLVIAAIYARGVACCWPRIICSKTADIAACSACCSGEGTEDCAGAVTKDADELLAFLGHSGSLDQCPHWPHPRQGFSCMSFLRRSRRSGCTDGSVFWK